MGLAVTAALVVLFVPLAGTSSAESRSGPGGEVEIRSTRTKTTLLESEGPRLAFIVAIPVVVVTAGLAAVLRGRRKTAAACAALMWTLIVLGAFSIGLLFVPSGLALVVAASITWATTSRAGLEQEPNL